MRSSASTIELFARARLRYHGRVASTGATTPASLAAKRPYVVVGCFIIGMLLTPPDIISQTLLAVPMWILFEFGIIFGRLAYREVADPNDQEPAGE